MIGILSVKAQAPVADFTASTVSGCGPLGVNFRDLSTGSPLFWTWDFGNGQISTLQNPSISYVAPGTYTVTLIVRNKSGSNSIRKTNYITVYPYPTASFRSNLTLACVPANLQFTDQSTPGQGSISQWNWDFGDGTTSNQPNPTHTYSQTGYYTVKLQVINSQGCPNSIAVGRYLRVVQGVQANFNWSQTSNSCSAPFLLNFTNQTAGPGNLSYTWDLGNGSTSTQNNPSTTYPSNTSYTVTLTAQSDLGCSQTTKKTVSFPAVNPKIGAPDSACINTPVNFLNSSTPTPVSSSWDFGDGTGSKTPNPAKTYNTATTYTVKLVNRYTSCVDSVLKNIKILNIPLPNFTAAKTVTCAPPFTVNFQDLTPPGTATGWQWDFGDGAGSTQQTPSHTYTTAGSFNVKLTVTNSTGCSGTVTKTKFIQIVPPTVTLNNRLEQGCINTTVFMPNVTVNAVDGIASYLWNSGGGVPATSTSPSPAFTYGVQGSYPITLTITTNDGCSNTTTFNNAIKVGNPTPAVFTASPTDACAQRSITFNSTSSPVDSWLWDFGNNDTSQTGPIVLYSYNDTGYHNIKLTVVNNGCSQTSTLLNYIHINPPIPNFGYTPGCNNRLLLQFSDSSKVDPAKGAPTYTLDFGDGTSSGPITGYPPVFPSHLYSAYGIYQVTLTVTNGGCTNKITRAVAVSPWATDFSVTPNPVCRNASFTLSATGNDPAIIRAYSWQVNGTTTVTGSPNYTNAFPNTGLYPLSLTVEDIYGCINTSPPHTITVTGPKAKFIPASTGGCRNSPIAFTDQSTDDGTYPLKTWTWNFGDGQTASFMGPPYSHLYADTGFYTARLTVQDVKGCTDTYSSPATVQITAPQAGFFAKDTFYCPNAPLPFTDSSRGYGLSWLWDFGDGGNAAIQNPSHRFPTSGQKYSVKLKVTDQVGCSDSLTRTNYIFIQRPIAAFSIADSTTICTPLQTTFTPNPRYYDSLYWNFGDGTTSTLPNTTHFYNTYDTFYAKLILRGPGGCLDSATRRIFVLNPYITTSFTYSPLKACDSILTKFTIAPPGYTWFSLYFGDGKVDSSGNTSPSHLYKSPNNYWPLLVLQDPTGCIVNYEGANSVTVLGATPFFTIDKHVFCDSGIVNITDYTITNDGTVSKTWDFGDGSTFAQPNPSADSTISHAFIIPGSLLVTIKVTTNSNCAENYTDTVRIFQTPHPLFTVINPPCVNSPIQFRGSMLIPNIDPVSWSWTFGNGQTSAQQNALVIYPKSGQYTVSLKTSVSAGCSDTTSRMITVNPLPFIKGPPEITTPVGFPVTLPFTYSSNLRSYSWTPVANLSCTDCSNPAANPIFSTLYKVTVTDSNNCVYSDSILVKTICNDKNYFIPNTFSPNGDGVNDVFYPRGSNLYNIQSMRVFNRWGQLVFERRNFPANSQSDGWNGTFNGRQAPADAYIYIMEVVCANGQIVALKGDVTLLR